MKSGKTCGVYVIWSRDRRRAYVGESSACEDRDTYRVAKLLGWPARVVRVLPPGTAKAARLMAETEVAADLQERGVWAVSNARGLPRRSGGPAFTLPPNALLTAKEVAAWLEVSPAEVRRIPHIVIGKRTRRWFVREVIASRLFRERVVAAGAATFLGLLKRTA